MLEKTFKLTFLKTTTVTETCEIIMSANSKEEAEFDLKKQIKDETLKGCDYETYEITNSDCYAKVINIEELD